MKTAFLLFIGAVVLATSCQGGIIKFDDSESTPIPPTPSNWFECPSIDSHDSYPNPYDCHKYFVCFDGNAWAFTCPAHLDYNPETRGCDYPDNVNCKAINTTPGSL